MNSESEFRRMQRELQLEYDALIVKPRPSEAERQRIETIECYLMKLWGMTSKAWERSN